MENTKENIVSKIKKGKFELYLHPRQKNGYITGNDLYKHLQDKGLLDGCATVEDLEEIQKEGVDFFRKYFENKYIFAWKSVRYRRGNLHVPSLSGGGVRVVLYWSALDRDWYGYDPALRHASSPKPSEPKTSVSLDLSPSEYETLKSVLNKLIKLNEKPPIRAVFHNSRNISIIPCSRKTIYSTVDKKKSALSHRSAL